MKDLVCEDELVGRYRITGKFIGEGSFSQARACAIWRCLVARRST